MRRATVRDYMESKKPIDRKSFLGLVGIGGASILCLKLRRRKYEWMRVVNAPLYSPWVDSQQRGLLLSSSILAYRVRRYLACRADHLGIP